MRKMSSCDRFVYQDMSFPCINSHTDSASPPPASHRRHGVRWRLHNLAPLPLHLFVARLKFRIPQNPGSRIQVQAQVQAQVQVQIQIHMFTPPTKSILHYASDLPGVMRHDPRTPSNASAHVQQRLSRPHSHSLVLLYFNSILTKHLDSCCMPAARQH